LENAVILDRITHLIERQDAQRELTDFVNSPQYQKWSANYLTKYTEAKRKKVVRRMNKKHKHDIIGAIAESLFTLCPPLKGLLRLRDQEWLSQKEQEILRLIEQQGIKTTGEIEKMIDERFAQVRLFSVSQIRTDYANALLAAAKGPDVYEQVFDSVLKGDEEICGWRKSFGEEQYLETLIELYDTNIDDLLILVRDHGFDPSKIKGKTTRAQIRSFLQGLARLDPRKIVAILEAIYREHSDEEIFKQTYLFSKAILE